MNEISKYIAEEETDINKQLFKKYFKIQKPSDMIMYLNKKIIKRKTMNQ